MAAAVRAAASVSQVDVDLWDGFAITSFEQFVEAVEAARADDPRIPAPTILGLRSWFHRNGRRLKDEGPKAGGEGEADEHSSGGAAHSSGTPAHRRSRAIHR